MGRRAAAAGIIIQSVAAAASRGSHFPALFDQFNLEHNQV
jgi:hypothetical protein